MIVQDFHLALGRLSGASSRESSASVDALCKFCQHHLAEYVGVSEDEIPPKVRDLMNEFVMASQQMIDGRTRATRPRIIPEQRLKASALKGR